MTDKKKIYLSLPITNYDIEERKEYAETMKAELLEKYPYCEVITPFDVCPDSTLPYNELMGRDIAALLDCDMVYFCRGWLDSKGCLAEYKVAKVYNKIIIVSETGSIVQ